MSGRSDGPAEDPVAPLDFETFFDVSPDMLCVRDRAGRFVKVNEAWTTSLGYSTAELEGAYLLPLIHPDDVASTRVEMERVRSKGKGVRGFVNRYRHRDGSYRHLEWHARQVGERVFAVARDVTERIAGEEERRRLAGELEAEGARLKAVQTVAKIGSWELDFRTGESLWSEEMHRIFDTNPKGPPPPHSAILAVMHPDDRDRAAAAFARLREAPSHHLLRYRLLLPGGRTRHVEARGKSSADGPGAPVRALGTCQDITELHEMQQANRRDLERALSETEAIVDNSHDVICTVDRDGRILRVSRRAERLWGYAGGDLIGSRFTDLSHPEDRRATEEMVQRVVNGAPAGGHINRCLCRDGSAIPMMWSATWSDAHHTLFAVGRDMREHLMAEDRLRLAQKMAAVGRLTGGIAHDFNNLLTAIVGSTEELIAALSEAPELQALGRVSLEAAERGAELIRRLLAYARNQPLASEAVDCNRMLESLRALVESTFTEDIEVTLEPAPAPLFCLADATHLTTALLNLCINARDAMPGGGRLRLRVERVLAGPDGARRPGESSFAVFTVEDSGQGMSADVKARAAEPFFTTKAAGQGSGLGLSMVHGFVDQSGGSLQIDSEFGAGTRVSLWLPETQPGPEPASAAREQDGAGRPPPRGRILLVEDDPLIRSQAERQLRAMGHVVVTASDGLEALALLGRSPDFDLLLTDVVMPNGLGGHELAERARAMNPGLRVLLSSGHSEDAVLRGVDRQLGVAFLPKPYRRSALEAMVGQLLLRPASGTS